MKTFTEYLNEGRGFELGGKKYSSGFGRYTCDGESISKEEYMKASAQYKDGKTSSLNTSTSIKADGEKKFGKEDADKVTEVIPTSKDYHISGGFPGGSKYAVKRQTMEVTYPRRKGMSTDAHTDIKYNYNKDSKALYSFYKSDAKRKNKELNKEDFIKYAIKTLSYNLDDKVKTYGDKNAKMDIEGIKSKVAEVFTSYINDNFEKISK
jgi:hypothetical protein